MVEAQVGDASALASYAVMFLGGARLVGEFKSEVEFLTVIHPSSLPAACWEGTFSYVVLVGSI